MKPYDETLGDRIGALLVLGYSLCLLVATLVELVE